MPLSPWLYKLVSTAFSEKAFTPSPTRFVEWQCKVTKQSKTTKILTNQWTANLHANTTTVTAYTFHLNSLECCPDSHSILCSSDFRMAFLSQVGVVRGLTSQNMAIWTLRGSKLWKDCILLYSTKKGWWWMAVTITAWKVWKTSFQGKQIKMRKCSRNNLHSYSYTKNRTSKNYFLNYYSSIDCCLQLTAILVPITSSRSWNNSV